MPTYTGSNLSEVYLGTSGDDVVRNIGVGLDVVTTGAGDDTVYVVPDEGDLLNILPDVISMGAGDDTLVIDYSGSDQAVETSRPLLDLSTGGLTASVSLAGLESLTFSGLQAIGANRNTAFAGAVSATAGFAVGKEFYDRRTTGLFSYRDLVWDAAGGGAGFLMLRSTQK